MFFGFWTLCVQGIVAIRISHTCKIGVGRITVAVAFVQFWKPSRAAYSRALAAAAANQNTADMKTRVCRLAGHEGAEPRAVCLEQVERAVQEAKLREGFAVQRSKMLLLLACYLGFQGGPLSLCPLGSLSVCFDLLWGLWLGRLGQSLHNPLHHALHKNRTWVIGVCGRKLIPDSSPL